MTGQKTCNVCGRTKGLADYYEHPHGRDGRQEKCKECAKAYTRKNRARRVEYYRDYDRRRYTEDPPSMARVRLFAKKYREAHPNAYAAHNKTNNAVRDGKLAAKPCEDCGSERVHAHHDDYAKPLHVRWLCAVHHRAWHDQNGPGRNAN